MSKWMWLKKSYKHGGGVNRNPAVKKFKKIIRKRKKKKKDGM